MPSDIPVSTQTPIRLSGSRAVAHRLIFSNLTDSAQTIFAFDLETGLLTPLFAFPPDMSLHHQPEVFGPGQDGESIPLALPKGLEPSWMHLSPDGKTLVTLQPALGGYPNFLHQIDLVAGRVVSFKLVDNYQWQVPIVANREPDLFNGLVAGAKAYASVLGTFNHLSWAPDSHGFVFTIGDQLEPPSQIYFVERGSVFVVPLASRAPGKDIGLFPIWSPDGRYIAYSRNPSHSGLWLIDMQNPNFATPLVPNMDIGRFKWSQDNRTIFFAGFDRLPQGALVGHLFRVEVPGGDIVRLAEAKPGPNETLIQINPNGQTLRGAGLIADEDHSTGSTELYGQVLYIDLNSNSALPLVKNQYIYTSSPTSTAGRVLLVFGQPCVGTILELPGGDTLYGPSENLCMKEGAWSPDEHLTGGVHGERVVIFDLDSGHVTIVAPTLAGENHILGWVPDPAAWDQARTPSAP